MVGSLNGSATHFWVFIRQRASLGIVFIYQVLALLLLAVVPVVASKWNVAPPISSAGERWSYLYLPYLVAFIYMACGLWVFSLRGKEVAGRAFASFTASVAIGIVSLFDVGITHPLTSLWVFAFALAGGGLFDLALVFPQEVDLTVRYPFLRILGYLLAGMVILFVFRYLDVVVNPAAFLLARRLESIFVTLALFVFLGWTINRWIKSTSPIVREQSRLILLGATIAFGPLVAWFCLTAFRPMVTFAPYWLLPTIAFPLFMVYAKLRYRLLDTDYLLSRMIVYTTLTLLVAGGYGLLVSGLSLIFGEIFLAKSSYLLGLVIFSLALMLNPSRLYLQKRVDALFFRGRTAFQEQLQAFGRQLTQTTEFPAIIQLLRKSIEEAISPSQLHIFVQHDSDTYYYATADKECRPSSDLRFTANSALAQTLDRRRAPLFIDEENTLSVALRPDRARLALLGAQLYIPLPGKESLTGWLGLGLRLSGQPYPLDALKFLESLCDQASLALQRSQVVTALQQRLHELDIITRVAEGINITLAFDDLLEMFYTQINQLIPTQDLRITLGDGSSQEFHHVFYLEKDERLHSLERLPISPDQGLETEVVRGRRAIITEDFERECHGRGVLPDSPGILAWMSVPLNVGADTIGAVSLGSRDPSVIYSSDQANLLQAIADLVAGAIVKARLLEESEKRARQLATLNEVTRSLTSMLELQPLLNRILQSAVEILDCEAGSLLLIDDGTGEAVFAVALGPVGTELVGKRLPPGVGLVGKVVKSKQALIQNAVQQSTDWFDTDQQTGYTTRDLLVVPMVVKDRVTGVLEVLNKRDGSPFAWEDLELLSAFAGQAAVAIENARLYTLTDQALAARVEELSVMQRVDRDLNASLDLERVLHITLEWSLSRSKADAGLAGLLDQAGLQVVAAQGYSPELVTSGNSHLMLEIPALEEAIRSGQLQSYLLADAHSQAIVPIRRESQLIGIILLESKSGSGFPEELLAFLARLSDHAAIAISNAQLYAAVQSANLAKSQFVSSAAHELKNPLTSIKGYSDLLVSGAVGAVNEGQARFLATVRSNADRMGTLVSDLQDISRIEAGQLHLQYSEVSFKDAVDEVVRTLRKQIEEKLQTLVVEVPASLPLVWYDNTRLVQILTNLVSNAHKYTPSGGQIAIQAECVSNRWDAEGATQVVHAWVKDSGIGISPEDRLRLFEQFFRSEDPRVREVTGTGLGLSVTKNLVEMQGGRIWFESEINQGTTFHFTVPAVTNS